MIPAASEKAVLSFGEDLYAFQKGAARVAQLSSQIATRISGEEIQGEMDGLRYIFDRTQALDDRSREGLKTLDAILEDVRALQRDLAWFEQITRNLQVLCRLIRIESARSDLTSEAFGTLAEDVKKLTDDIESGSEQLKIQSEALIALIEDHHRRVKQSCGGQRGNSRAILDRAVVDFNVLQQRNDQSSRHLSETAHRWKKISLSMGEIVTALQFHDITRQRIEHAAEAIRHLASQLEPGASSEGNGNGRKTRLASVLNSCGLQQAQLRQTSEEMEDAGERVIRSVQEISEGVAGITAQTRGITDGEKSATDSFLPELKKSLLYLQEIILEYESGQTEIISTLDDVSEKIAVMSGFISKVERIGIEIRKVALNAHIHANAAGEEGLALGVLAGSIHQLSIDTDSRISLVASELQTVLAHADELSDGSRGEEGTEKMGDRIGKMIQVLFAIEADISASLKEVEAETNSLRLKLKSAASAIRVHEEMGKGIRRSEALLHDIAEEMESVVDSAGVHPESGTAVEAAALRYTMSRERDVHRAFLTAGAPAAALSGAPPVPAEGAGAEGGLGDNVELF